MKSRILIFLAVVATAGVVMAWGCGGKAVLGPDSTEGYESTYITMETGGGGRVDTISASVAKDLDDWGGGDVDGGAQTGAEDIAVTCNFTWESATLSGDTPVDQRGNEVAFPDVRDDCLDQGYTAGNCILCKSTLPDPDEPRFCRLTCEGWVPASPATETDEAIGYLHLSPVVISDPGYDPALAWLVETHQSTLDGDNELYPEYNEAGATFDHLLDIPNNPAAKVAYYSGADVGVSIDVEVNDPDNDIGDIVPLASRTAIKYIDLLTYDSSIEFERVLKMNLRMTGVYSAGTSSFVRPAQYVAWTLCNNRAEACVPLMGRAIELIDLEKMYEPSAEVFPSGVITWTVTMSEPLEKPPRLHITQGADADVPCSLDADPTKAHCPYSSVNTCTALHDYTGEIYSGEDADGNVMEPVTVTWNAMDDEFQTQSVPDCWVFGGAAISTWTIANDVLQIDVFDWQWDTEMQQANVTKPVLTGNYAVTLHISENLDPGSLPPDSYELGGIGTIYTGEELNEGYNIFVSGFYSDSEDPPNVSTFFSGIVTFTDDWNYTEYVPDGSWGDLSRYSYFCMTRYYNVRHLYASIDGINFVHFSEANTDMAYAEHEPTPLDYVFDPEYSAVPMEAHVFTFDPNLTGYSPKYDYVRFKSANITGTAADCPVEF